MEQRIGTCSLCGGSVVGWNGAWYGVNPPPAPRCTKCGAFTRSDVIEMVRPGLPITGTYATDNFKIQKEPK